MESPEEGWGNWKSRVLESAFELLDATEQLT